ncbi:hypothetical protein BC835DRAFT_1353639 [Cytidiella melzeri]|nr:hypothetical protein BC835DRAFT_1353639 [Cytidiella melzeri]
MSIVLEATAIASGILTLGYGVLDLTTSRSSTAARDNALSKLDQVKQYMADLENELAVLEEQDRSGPYHFDDVAHELGVVAPDQLVNQLRGCAGLC